MVMKIVMQGIRGRRTSEKSRVARRAGIARRQLRASGDESSPLDCSRTRHQQRRSRLTVSPKEGEGNCLSGSARHKAKPWDVRRGGRGRKLQPSPIQADDPAHQIWASPIDALRGDGVQQVSIKSPATATAAAPVVSRVVICLLRLTTCGCHSIRMAPRYKRSWLG